MNPLTPTIKCLRIRMAKCFPGILVLTAGMGHPWRRSRCPKVVLRSFPWMSSWHHLGRRQTPDQRHHMAQRFHTDRGPHMVTPMPMFCSKTIIRLMNMSVFLLTAMFTKLRTFLHILMSIIHLLQNYLLGFQSLSSLSHPWRCGWLRRINFSCRERSPAGNRRLQMPMLGT